MITFLNSTQISVYQTKKLFDGQKPQMTGTDFDQLLDRLVESDQRFDIRSNRLERVLLSPMTSVYIKMPEDTNDDIICYGIYGSGTEFVSHIPATAADIVKSQLNTA